jgi:hypothetical protein
MGMIYKRLTSGQAKCVKVDSIGTSHSCNFTEEKFMIGASGFMQAPKISNEKFSENEEIFINCIGVDNKKHVCEPHLEITKCGVKIKRKTLNRTDVNKFSCYPCTY